MSFGVDVNYKVKKLESRARAAEEALEAYQQQAQETKRLYEERIAELQTEITRLRETGVRLPKGRAPKPKTTTAPKPRGRKRNEK